MSIYMTVYQCICMHEYMYVCMHVLYAYICVCMHLCVDAYMYICMHTCMYVILKLGFEQYGRGNCPSWEGNCPGGIVQEGKCPFPGKVT